MLDALKKSADALTFGEDQALSTKYVYTNILHRARRLEQFKPQNKKERNIIYILYIYIYIYVYIYIYFPKQCLHWGGSGALSSEAGGVFPGSTSGPWPLISVAIYSTIVLGACHVAPVRVKRSVAPL